MRYLTTFGIFIITIYQAISQNQDYYNWELIKASYYNNIDTIIWALKNNADVNTKTFDGVTPLMYAVQNENYEAIKILIASGADVNAIPQNKITALHTATKLCNLQIMDYLIQNGANVNIPDNNGNTPIYYSCLNRCYLATDMLIYYEANLNHKNNDGLAPIHIATFLSDTTIIQLLLNNKADVNMQTSEGATPLMISVITNNDTIADILLKNGANINLTDNNDRNALFYAVALKKYKLVEKFLSHQNINSLKVDENTKKLIELTFINNDKQMYDLLKKHNIKAPILPYFKTLMLGISEISFNSDDFMYGLNIGLYDYRYKILFNIGTKFRIAPNRILVKSTEDTYYQFWEKRNVFYFGVRKNLSYTNENINHYGMFVSGKFAMTNAQLIASNRNIPTKYRIIPEIGLFYRTRYIGFDLSYSYFNYDIFNISPHRINLGILIFLNFSNYLKDIIKFNDYSNNDFNNDI